MMLIFKLPAFFFEYIICYPRSSKSRRDYHSHPRSDAECQMRGTDSIRMLLLDWNESVETDKRRRSLEVALWSPTAGRVRSDNQLLLFKKHCARPAISSLFDMVLF